MHVLDLQLQISPGRYHFYSVDQENVDLIEHNSYQKLKILSKYNIIVTVTNFLLYFSHQYTTGVLNFSKGASNYGQPLGA